MDMQALKRVGEVYLKSESVKETADRCDTSEVKARRILITLGLWSSPTSEQIRELWNKGMSIGNIAEKLCVSEKAVEAYLPYRKGVYGLDEKSVAALRTELCRNRKSIAATNMRKKEMPMSDRIKSWEELCEQYIADEKKRFTEEAYRSLIFTESDLLPTPSEKTTISVNTGTVLHLRLELAETDDLSASEKKLAKVEHSISRDVLVPGSMTLHQMHYMIQRLFGWQNSHLHHFSLDKQDFDLVTAGHFGPYADLCGTLFLFPGADDADRYWDDNYDGTVSFKTWLKQKYAYPKLHQSVSDTWVGGQMEVTKFREHCPDVSGDTFLVDVEAGFEQELNQLSERINVRDLFLHKADRQDIRAWKSSFISSRQRVKEKWADVDQDEMQEAMEQLNKWRNSYHDWQQAMWMQPEETRKQVQKHYHMSMDKLLKEHKEAIEGWAYTLSPVLDECNPTLQPFFESINYAYDYGDGWRVRITLIETYQAKTGEEYETLSAAFANHPKTLQLTAKDIGLDRTGIIDLEQGPWFMPYAIEDKKIMDRYRYLDSTNKEVGEELRRKLATVHVKGNPICVSADGLSVLDDCGGVGGFVDMLKTIYGKDKEESAEMRAWANGLGWTGRRTKSENML